MNFLSFKKLVSTIYLGSVYTFKYVLIEAYAEDEKDGQVRKFSWSRA